MKTKTDMLTQEKELASFYKVLSHPTRVAILTILGEDEACVCHLEAILGHRQSYLSQQLAVLRENNLIQDRRDGWNVYYQLKDKTLLDIIQQSAQFLGLDEITQHLSAEDCPCPKCAAKRSQNTCCNPADK